VLIVVEQLRSDAREAFTRSVSGVDLIVGPRGGKLELLMGIVSRNGVSGAGIAYGTYREIVAPPGIAWALPVCFGDSHHGFPVMGTDTSTSSVSATDAHSRLRSGGEIRLRTRSMPS